MELGFYGVFIIAGVLAVQFFFSTRSNTYWGAIVPVVYVGVLTWMLISNHIESALGYILYLLIGLFFLIAEWHGGRRYRREKTNKELNKMKTLDIS